MNPKRQRGIFRFCLPRLRFEFVMKLGFNYKLFRVLDSSLKARCSNVLLLLQPIVITAQLLGEKK